MSISVGPILVRFILMWTWSHSAIPYLLFVRVAIPLLDYILPLDMKNRRPEGLDQLEKDWRYLVPIYAYFVSEVYLNYWLLNVLYYELPLLSFYQQFLFILITGTGTGVSIIIAHEFTHRKEPLLFGILMNLRLLYTNLGITHT